MVLQKWKPVGQRAVGCPKATRKRIINEREEQSRVAGIRPNIDRKQSCWRQRVAAYTASCHKEMYFILVILKDER